MNPIAAENFTTISHRWPGLALEILAATASREAHWIVDTPQVTLEVAGQRLWSAFDSEGEARCQAMCIPTGSDSVCLYGIGGGDLIRELLGRDSLRRLTVVPLDFGLARLLFENLDHRDWLADPRVSLEDFRHQRGVLHPFFTFPGEIRLHNPEARALCERVRLEQETAYAHEYSSWFEALRNRQIATNAELIGTDGDVASLFGSAAGGTLFVIGAGPTLKATRDWLKAHRAQGTIIAVDAAVRPLAEVGIQPDVVISIDPHSEGVLAYLAGHADCAAPLVYFPVVHPEVLRQWRGTRLTAYSDRESYAELRARHPKGELFQAGSVIHAATDLAVKMGARRIILFGADFGFPGGETHAATTMAVGQADALSMQCDLSQALATDGWGREITTVTNLLGYRLDLEDYIARHPEVEFINSSRDGAAIAGTHYLDDSDHE